MKGPDIGIFRGASSAPLTAFPLLVADQDSNTSGADGSISGMEAAPSPRKKPLPVHESAGGRQRIPVCIIINPGKVLLRSIVMLEKGQVALFDRL
jgi:hypothetical protein